MRRWPNLARELGVDPESELRNAKAKFSQRFAAMEAHLEAQGRSVHAATLQPTAALHHTGPFC